MRKAKPVVLESLLVAALGLAFALAANSLSPHGLRLSRNYFPTGDLPPPAAPGSPAAIPPLTADADPSLAATLQRLQQRGLQLANSNAVIELFRDHAYQQGLTVFIDARDDDHYQAGHIPGAWQFDHYRAERHLPTVLPVCLNATKVVIYCHGGTCEDSEFAAVMLRDSGVTKENLFIYAGGIMEWKTNGLPVEIGNRLSGKFLNRKP